MSATMRTRPYTKAAGASRKLILLLCLVALQSSPWALAGDHPDDAISTLLDGLLRARGIEGKAAAWRELLSNPDDLGAYLEAMFDKARDPLMSEDRQGFTEEEIEVLERRRSVGLRLLARPYSLAALATLDDQQRRNAVLMIDHLCENVRAAVFQRALEQTDGDSLDSVLRQVMMFQDLPLIDAVRPLLRIDDSQRSLWIVTYLRCFAGQLEVMRNVIDARPANGSLRIALWYAIHAGDEEYATNAAIECVRQFADDGAGPSRFPPVPRGVNQFAYNRGVQAAGVLARLSTARAREAVMDLLQDDDCPDHIEEALLKSLPNFFAEERLPLYEKAYGPDKRPYPLASYLRWLERHDNKAGLPLAKARLASILETWDSPVTWRGIPYLVWCGDQETIDLLSEAAKGENLKAFHKAVPLLIEAGLWDSLPDDIIAKLEEASQDMEGKKHVNYGRLLAAARKQSTPRVFPLLRFLADNDRVRRDQALLLMLELGDRTVIPELEQIYPEKLARERVPIAAALYSAGDTDHLEDLCSAAKSSWLTASPRIAAIKALANAPEEQREKAFFVLAQLLLDPNGIVSDEAYKALLVVSSLEAVDFNSWADDKTRRKQSAPLIKWVNSLQ